RPAARPRPGAPPPQRQVARADEEQPERGRSVSPRPADFLVIGFDRSRRAEMDRRADVRTVDAHAEGVGRNDDVEPALGELPLNHVARLSVEPGVVGPRAPAARSEAAALLVGLLARGRVHDPTPPPPSPALESPPPPLL